MAYRDGYGAPGFDCSGDTHTEQQSFQHGNASMGILLSRLHVESENRHDTAGDKFTKNAL